MLIKYSDLKLSLILFPIAQPIYFIYTRTSSKAAMESSHESVPRQLESCYRFLKGKKISRIFSDSGVTGTIELDKRPNGKILVGLAYICVNYYNFDVHVIAESADRIARSKKVLLHAYQLSLKFKFKIFLCVSTYLLINTGYDADRLRDYKGGEVEDDKNNRVYQLSSLKRRLKAKNLEKYQASKDITFLTLNGTIKVDGRASALKKVPGLLGLFEQFGDQSIDKLTAMAKSQNIKMPGSDRPLGRSTIARNLRLFRMNSAYINSNISTPKGLNGKRSFSTFSKCFDENVVIPETKLVAAKNFKIPNLLTKTPCSLELSQNFYKKVFSSNLHYCSAEGVWLYYCSNSNLWLELSELGLRNKLMEYLTAYYKELNKKRKKAKQAELNISRSTINNIIEFLREMYFCESWPINSDLIAFNNGVFSLKESKFISFSPKLKLRTKLCFDFIKKPLETPKTNAWLLRVLGSEDKVELIKFFIFSSITGQTQIQKYMELVGPGRTGKSTLIDFMIACIGAHNYISTDLIQIEKSRFELGNIINKKLIVISDSERYIGSVNNLKRITGGDPLRLEKKFHPVITQFRASGLVVIAANEPLQTTDLTTGLSRRRILVLLDNKITGAAQIIISSANNQLTGCLAEELPSFVSNLLLTLTKDQVSDFFLNLEQTVPSLEKEQEVLNGSNPIIAFINDRITYHESNTYKVYLGAFRYDKGDTDSTAILSYIYPSYLQYCRVNGFKSMNSYRFCQLLEEHFNHRLNKPIVKGRDKFATYYTNLSILIPNEDHNY